VSTGTLSPNGFYGENFSLVNTYDSDTVNTTTSYLPAANTGTCAVQSTPQTFNFLFNNSLLCASQALAIWITSDLSVMNNIYTTSLQDTIYAGSQGSGSNGFVPARQYWFRGKVTGTVDYIFGDAAAVFDHSSIYTVPHGTGISGTATIEAQNKANQTGGSGDYLSGYVVNSTVFTSQQTGMTGLDFGRPYGTYSTWIMLNSYIDQVAPVGYIEFSGDTNLPTSTYDEYNDIPYTDPSPNTPDINGVTYLGLGGSTGQGVTGTRETTSQSPGTPMANNAIKTSMTQVQAQAYYPTNFLGKTVSSLLSPTQNWNPTAAISSAVNGFVPSGTTASVVGGSSVTILMRPQTPGLGAITNNVYTIPTGTYILTDTYNGGNPTVIASGSLDAAGEAYFTSSGLSDGTHNLSWTYSGDNNFAGSTTASGYVLTVTGPAASSTTTTFTSTNPVVYGSSASVTVQVASSGGTPTGTATLTINGTQMLTAPVTSGTATFTVPGLTAGTYSLTASYVGSPTFTPSTTVSPSPLVVNPFPLTVTAACANRVYGAANSCSATVTGGYQYSDSVTTVFTATPTGTSTATPSSPAGPYVATPVYTLTAFGNTNYTVNPVNGSFNITGGAPQVINFAALPNFTNGGSYQLTARTTSGLPVSYTVTSGNANVTGTTLHVTGTGAVMVQASTPADPTGDYAPATPVSEGFTAQ
jgi:pectin methylesterase-like acyl-CoA thioesterase